MDHLRSASLFVHILALLAYGAATFGGVLIDRSLWAAARKGRWSVAAAHAATVVTLGRAAQLAAVLTLASAVGLLHSTGFVLLKAGWVHGKIALFLALAGYGGGFGGRAGKRVVALLTARAESNETGPMGPELEGLQRKFGVFHRVMPAMLVLVILLATFRPT